MIMWEPDKYRFTQLNPLNIVIIYLLIGFLWILFSDRLLEQVMDDPAVLTRFQTLKGWFYVIVTGLLLFVLIQGHSKRITRMRGEFFERFEQFRTLLEQGSQVVIQVDSRLKFSYTNSAFREILGYDDQEMQQMDDFEQIIHPVDMERFFEIKRACGEAQKSQEPLKKQVRMRHKDQGWRWYLMILTDKRRFEHIESRLLLIRDIHDETMHFEQLKESQQRFEHLFRDAPVGYHSFGPDFKFIDINSAELELLGYERDELIGRKTWADVIVPEELPVFENHKKELLDKGRVWNRLYTIVRKDGTRRSVILNAKAFFDDRDSVRYTLGNVTDITERIKAQEQVRRLNESLEEKVRQRTRDLEKANLELEQTNRKLDQANLELEQSNRQLDQSNLELEQSNRQLEQANRALETINDELGIRNRELKLVNKELESFAYSVSHDLRAPLRGIDGFSQALLDMYETKLDKRGKDYLNRVRQASQRMGMLIDDILELSRISRTSMNMEQVNLAAICREILSALRERDPDRNVESIIPEELIVTGDTGLLRIAMQNLIDNAWKFSSSRDPAVIEAGMVSSGAGNMAEDDMTFFVRDNGAGFNMKYHDKLFMAFQRLHTQDAFPGSGIGLATVQRIIHRHSGTIWAESRENEGAIFYFKLPDKSV